MYFTPVDEKTVRDTLAGFRLGCAACGAEVPLDIWQAVVTGRGWQVLSARFEGQFYDRGLSESQVIDEMLAIEIEGWKRYAATLADGE
jgi:hypothetical protein